jgi:signal transduction histidine kinase
MGKEPAPTVKFDEIGTALAVDAQQFTMVLTHLIGNAQDATPTDGEVGVTIHEGAGRIAISISDTGCGMSPEFIRDRLFKPFDSTKGVQGMGIGAYQAREFVQSLGGELTVESELSRGTTITMTVPIKNGLE